MTTHQRLKVEEIWKEILNLREVDLDRSFMDLGGTSLTANQLVSKLKAIMGFGIPVIRIFEHPTLRQFNRYLEGGVSASEPLAKIELEQTSDSEGRTENNGHVSNSDIAIIGIACRFPGAPNVDQYWQNLIQGKESIQHFSIEELSPEVPEDLKSDPRLVKARGFIDNPYDFDAAHFDMGPMETKLTDPQQRILLETAWEALENAGHGAGSFSGKTGVFAGIEDNTYYKQEIAPFPDAEKKAGRFSVMTGNEKDFVAMRIAHKLGLNGPALSIHTACSTSLVVVIMACKSLRNKECDMALAGGATVHFPTHDGYYFQEGGVFSPDGHCRPFDKDAQGTVFTDGSGMVVLKRLKDAIQDKNTIYAVVKGGAINNDGADRVSFSAPSISGQTNCIIDAHADAGIDPATIQYVEAHGTATPMGDPIEVEALRQAFRTKTQKKNFCGLGSVKSNIGHTTTAAGVASLIKTTLALKNKMIPATLHFKIPNPGLDLENSPFFIVDRLTEWRKEKTPRRAGVSSFGIGGTNSHLILEEAPDLVIAPEQTIPMERPFEIFPVSAKSPAQRDRLLDDLSTVKNAARDIAFSLQTGRTRFKIRGARIRMAEPGTEDLLVQRELKAINRPHTVFMFPGQGSQYIEMGKSLYRQFPEFRKTFDGCCEILNPDFGFDFKSFIFNSENKETLENTKYTQPALFVIEVSLGRMLLDWGITPDLMIGHSVGEFSAAHLAGIFSLEDGLKLISARGRLMADLPRGKMLSVRGPVQEVKQLIGDEVDMASINSPIHSVVAGSEEQIQIIQKKLESKNFLCRLLHTSHAFHSKMMIPVVEPFHAIAKEVQFNPPKFKIISTVTGESMSRAEAIDPAYWANHLRATVYFSQAILKSIEEGGNLYLEVGPRTTLSGLTLQHLKAEQGTTVPMLGETSDSASEIGSFAQALAKLWVTGLELPWNKIWIGGNRIPVVQYPFDKKTFRFSENRVTEIRTVRPSIAASAPAEVVAVALPGHFSESVEVLLNRELAKFLGEYSGMTIDSVDATFFECGFDSLVLMQIGVQLGKKYGVSVPLVELMTKTNTVKRLAAHIAKLASADKLPKAEPYAKPSQAQPEVQMTSLTGDLAHNLHQQLQLMKEMIESQLKILEAGTPIPKKIGNLIRAKHYQPPVPGAFRAKTSNGSKAWFRFDSKKNRYESLK